MQDDHQMSQDSFPHEADSHGPSKPAVSRGARACMVCRAAKMKCVGAEEDGKKPCQRCRRSNSQCVFEKHRRGRKPGSKISEQSKMLRKIEKGSGGAGAKSASAAGPSAAPPTPSNPNPSPIVIKRDDHPPPQLPFPISDSRSAPPPDPYTHAPRYSPREQVYVPSQAQGQPPSFPTLTSPYTTHAPHPQFPPPPPSSHQHAQHQHQHQHPPPPPHPPAPPLPPISIRPNTAPAPGHSTAPPQSSPQSHPTPMDQDDPADESDSDSEQDSHENEVTQLYPAAMVERENRKHSFFNTVLTANPPETAKGKGKPPGSLAQKGKSAGPGARGEDAQNGESEGTYPENATGGEAQQYHYGYGYSSQHQGSSHPRHHRPLMGPRHFLINFPAVQDPVEAGIVSPTEVQFLFSKFFDWLNPFVNLLDPQLHQPGYVREKCPFLYTMVLMAGCKFWKPEKYRKVLTIAEEYCMRAFVECWNWKRIEVVQAFMCMTYWKEPDDSRTWTFIGYAGRLAIELGLNVWSPILPENETLLQRLERRNRERTFLVLWVHDRSLSMQTGRQWMLPEDDLVRNADFWYRGSDHLLVDIVVSAQVALRRTAAEVTDLFYLHKGGKAPADVNYEVLLRSANHRLQQWDETWSEVLRGSGSQAFHHFLLKFFKLHVRLFLNSIGLHSHLTGLGSGQYVSPRLPALTICYSSAVETLKLVSEEMNKLEMLRYGQDSITVMTAYSAVFLLKLLKHAPELEEVPVVYDLINTTAQAYQDSAKTMTTASLAVEIHGRFLRTLVLKDQASRARGRRKEGSVTDSGSVAGSGRHIGREECMREGKGVNGDVNGINGAVSVVVPSQAPPGSSHGGGKMQQQSPVTPVQQAPPQPSRLQPHPKSQSQSHSKPPSTSMSRTGLTSSSSTAVVSYPPPPHPPGSSHGNHRTNGVGPGINGTGAAPSSSSPQQQQQQQQSQAQAQVQALADAAAMLYQQSRNAHQQHQMHSGSNGNGNGNGNTTANANNNWGIYPPSPHLPAHPLISPDGEIASLDLASQQAAVALISGNTGGGGNGGHNGGPGGQSGHNGGPGGGYGNTVINGTASSAGPGGPGGGNGNNGQGVPNTSTPTSAVPQDDPMESLEGLPPNNLQKMEVAYWYNVHQEMGYQHGPIGILSMQGLPAHPQITMGGGGGGPQQPSQPPPPPAPSQYRSMEVPHHSHSGHPHVPSHSYHHMPHPPPPPGHMYQGGHAAMSTG